MPHLPINMDIRALHIRQALEHLLQSLGDIMALAHAAVLVHHDIDLDHHPGPAVIGAHGIDALDHFSVVCEADIRDPLLQAGRGGDANQEEELVVCGAQPQGGDEQGEEDGPRGINPPGDIGAEDAGEEPDAVDDRVVAVVFP